MLYNEQSVRDNIRNRDGKRVFFLGEHDTLTPAARDWLRQERIDIRPAAQAAPAQYRLENGAILTRKPENMTHLRGDILVPKTAPIIAFRGAMDRLEAELLLAQLAVDEKPREKLEEILALARNILRWEVMQEPAVCEKLCSLTPDEQRERSHFPQKCYGQAHFMPAYTDGAAILQLNRARCAARNAELAAARAFETATGGCLRPDIVLLLNRMSSMLYILMIEEKAAQSKGEHHGSNRNTGIDRCGR